MSHEIVHRLEVDIKKAYDKAEREHKELAMKIIHLHSEFIHENQRLLKRIEELEERIVVLEGGSSGGGLSDPVALTNFEASFEATSYGIPFPVGSDNRYHIILAKVESS